MISKSNQNQISAATGHNNDGFYGAEANEDDDSGANHLDTDSP